VEVQTIHTKTFTLGPEQLWHAINISIINELYTCTSMLFLDCFYCT